MDKQEMIKQIKELEQEHCILNGNGDYFVGVRFEDKERVVGEEIGNSKHNIDREYEGDMPEYGTYEYEELFEFDGASAFEVSWIVNELEKGNAFATYHCYFIVGTSYTNEDDALDDGEVVIEDAVVKHIFY